MGLWVLTINVAQAQACHKRIPFMVKFLRDRHLW